MITVLFTLFYAISMAQTNCSQDSTRYLDAYNYIIQESANQEKTIEVSDSIVDLDRFWFSQDIADYPTEKEILGLQKNNDAEKFIVFSKIEDNVFRADLLPYKQQFNKFDYKKMTIQNVGQIYLFIFNKDGSLKFAFSHEITFDQLTNLCFDLIRTK